MDIEKFYSIKEKWSKTSSWAIWAKAGKKPKSNISDLSIFDLNNNQELLNILNPNIIMVGLNAADRPIIREWGNFHDLSPNGQDYKIRFAFDGTKYWGAYMTDLIKEHHQTNSNILRSFLKNNPKVLEKNIFRFYEELNDIETKNPLIIAFGNDTYSFLKKVNIDKQYKVIKIMHYSHHISKEEYRRNVLKILGDNI